MNQYITETTSLLLNELLPYAKSGYDFEGRECFAYSELQINDLTLRIFDKYGLTRESLEPYIEEGEEYFWMDMVPFAFNMNVPEFSFTDHLEGTLVRLIKTESTNGWGIIEIGDDYIEE